MNKIILAMMVAATALLTALADPTDICLYYKTKGIDTYQDGTTVLDGEFYALVWVKDGCTFAGFKANGELADADNNRVVSIAPNAVSGRLAKTQTQVSQGDAAKLVNGSLYVILVDTRNADGTLAEKIELPEGGWKPSAINGYKAVYSESVGATLAAASLGITLPIQVDIASIVPEDAPKPVITSATLRKGPNGQEMVIKVKGTAAYLRYTAAGADLGGGTTAVDATAANGKDDVEKEIEIVIPAKGNSGLFKVIRK